MDQLQWKAIYRMIFEFIMQPYQQQCGEAADWRSEQRTYHLTKAFKIIRKYYYRTFMGKFKSVVYQMLIQNITRQKEKEIAEKNEIDWPYRSLLLKPNKTEHEMLEIQFVNMCAEKIQTVFKGYMTRKRYRIASKRVNKFVGMLGALVKGWKVRNIMRCFKIKEEVKSIGIKRGEVEKEKDKSSNPNNKFNLRRLQYLKNSLSTETDHFYKHFYELYNAGGWIYEPREEVPKFKKVQKWSDRKRGEPMKENNYIQSQVQLPEFIPEKHEQPQPQPQKKKRVREMRDNARKGRNKEAEVNQKEQPTRNVDIEAKNEAMYSQASINVNTMGEDRPIQAKGAYSYNQEQNIIIAKNKQQPSENVNVESSNAQDDDKKAQLRKIEKKKMQKRKKYDPRKAIQEQKKRKKEQQEQQEQQPQNKGIEVKSQTIIPPKAKPKQKSKQKDVVQSKSQKALKTQKDDNNRSTVNFPKNKAKVQPRIDCWGNRKTVTKKNPQEYIKANKIVFNACEAQEQVPERNTGLITSERLAAKIQQRRQKEKWSQYSEQRQKARIEIERNCQQSQRIQEFLQKKKQQKEIAEFYAIKERKAQAMRQRQRVSQQQRAQHRQRRPIVHKSIELLMQTYDEQYKKRYYKLKPNLQLLAVARNIEKSNPTAVLLPDSDYVQRMIEQNSHNHRFWSKVTKMDNFFKQFVKN